MRKIRCSMCGGVLEYLGGPGSLEQWRGNVCTECDLVFCPNCITVGGPTPCPKCHAPTHPASRIFLTKKPKESRVAALLGKLFGNREYHTLVKRLKDLIVEANNWGCSHKWPLFEKYPQYQEIREIGKRLYEIGGIGLMRKAYRKVERSVAYPGMSEMWWHGVGEWLG